MTNEDQTPPPLPAVRERATISVHSLLTYSTSQAFEAWCRSRGLGASAAVRGLILELLWKEATGTPVRGLPGEMPPEVARQIVTDLEARRTAPGA